MKMRRTLTMIAVILTLCSVMSYCIASPKQPKFNVKGAEKEGYHVYSSEDGDIYIDNDAVTYLSHIHCVDDIKSVEYSDVIVLSDGDDSESYLRIWFEMAADQRLDLSAVSMEIEGSVYTFSDLFREEYVFEENGVIYQQICIVIGEECRNIIDILANGIANYELEDLGGYTIPVVLHGTEDIETCIDGYSVWDLLSMEYAISEYGNGISYEGAPVSVRPVIRKQETTEKAEAGSNLKVNVGSHVFFGQYEQDNIPENGLEPIEWVVKEIKDGRALLVSKYTLDCQPYNTSDKDVTWATCTLRRWLNNDFLYSAFTQDEILAIADSTIPNGVDEQPKVEKWNPSVGNDTIDKVFLLSYPEVRRYFTEIAHYGTEYANDKGAKGVFFDKESAWYTRSSGKDASEAAYVYATIDESSCAVFLEAGILPAIWVNISADWDNYPYEVYQEANRFANQNDYDSAIRLLDTLGSYNDSIKLAAEYRYEYAKWLYGQECFDDAISELKEYAYFVSEFELVPDESCSMLRNDCLYAKAVRLMNSGRYSEAITVFIELGQYKDSMQRYIDCLDNANIPFNWLTKNNGSAVNAGGDDFSGNEKINGTDPHFGWSLGRFLLSGYTEKDDSGDIPVFLKTPGDDLILQFVIEQDIDLLDGNNKLKILDMESGLDTELGVQNTDMGRGMLVIRHTDYHNADTQPIIYRDYLSATESGTADTHVVINEEGIYEVALDYAIDNSKLFAATNYYRVSFKFEVKNGSSMFFLFDSKSGGELEDYSVTENGFSVNLANSHFLTIDVVRYALNQTENGLDVRASAPASDGDKFERAGYYVISVTNNETNVVLIKHIFVGNMSDLNAYANADSTLNSFR